MVGGGLANMIGINTCGGQAGAGGGGGGFTNTHSTEYDGVDDYAETNSTYSELDGLNDIAFSFWIKPTKCIHTWQVN